MLKTEPVAVFGAIQTALLAAVVALTAFNVWTPTQDQVSALTALYVAVTAAATMVLRGKVSPAGDGVDEVPAAPTDARP